jgi:translocation and assembly module TamA
LLGSDTGFIQLVAEGGGIVALPWRLSLKTRAKVGATLFDDKTADLPSSLRFFAGGDNSVRGYSYKSLGPKDASGDVVGGRDLLQGSLELERALFDKWGVSVFYDAGNAFDAFDDVMIYQGAGVGLHYYTPIGAINLYLARQLGVSSPSFRVHFSIGLLL